MSSYGSTATLDLKPDLGAPGGLIRSTYPLETGAYATISGTSMSSPHVAGAVALLRQARPTLAAAGFRDVLQNSADPAVWSGSPGSGLLDIVHRQGAGMLDIDDAIASKTTISPGVDAGLARRGPQRADPLRPSGAPARAAGRERGVGQARAPGLLELRRAQLPAAERDAAAGRRPVRSDENVLAFPWNGTRMHDNGKGTADHRKLVPDGQYKIVARALKALGDPGNPADWEIRTSPTITIDRP